MFIVVVVAIQSLSLVTPWTATCQASLSFTTSWSFLRLMSIESVMPSNHLNLCCTLLLLPSIFPSVRVFSNDSALCIRWPKYWSFSISPSSEYSGLISFRIDWLDLLAVLGTLKSLLRYHSSKASSSSLTVQKSQEAGQVVWYSHLFQNFPQFVVIHTVKGFGIVSKVEVDVFLELSCFFGDPTDVGNLISGSSAFSESSLNIWKFMVHVLLKPGVENFEHYFANL